MNFLNFDLKKFMFFLFIVALPLVSINTQKGPVDTGWYNKPFSFLADLTKNAFFSFSSGVRGTTAMYLNLIKIKEENQQILSKNHELLARLAAMEELKKENERLNKLLDFKSQSKMELVAAKVMGRDLLTDHATLLIDKGTHHGLKQGMAVITTEGVVGYIFRPESFSSHILLITDRYSVVDGVIARSRARGIVEGKNQSSCALRYVEKSEDIQAGDIVVTSGIDNIFPKGFPVAKVISVESKSYAVSMKVELEPVVDPNEVEEVFIVMNASQEDFSGKVSFNQR
jgi:rod shape-determining protein MreC